MIRSFTQSFPDTPVTSVVPVIFDDDSLKVFWDLVLFGTDTEAPNAHLGIGPKILIKILTVSKSVFDLIMTSAAKQIYWERNVWIRFDTRTQDYKFKVDLCWRSLFFSYAKEDFELEIAKKESLESRKNYIETLVDYFDPKKEFDSQTMYDWLFPIEDLLSDPKANSRAQYYLACCYDDPGFEGANEGDAFLFFELAAKQGHLKAQENLIRMGDGLEDFVEVPFTDLIGKDSVKIDILDSLHNIIDKVTKYCMKLYKTKNTALIKDEIFFLLNPLRKYLKDNKGSSDAHYLLGWCYKYNIVARENEEKAFKHFMLAAKSGNTDAQYHLSICYRKALGVEKNNREAFKWAELSAKSGNADAQNRLGFFYETGISVMKDKVEAFKWRELSAKSGNTDAQYSIGVCYDSGIGVNMDKIKALKWIILAAKAGHSEAQGHAGVFYEKGVGTKKDDSKMLKWTRLAANQENTDAQFNLSRYYENGEGVLKDLKEAFKWMERAALNGDEDAQYRLSMFYKEGKGVVKDDEKAFLWMKLSSDYDYDSFDIAMKALEPK